MSSFQIRCINNKGLPHAVVTLMTEDEANKQAELLADWGHTEIMLIDTATGAERPFRRTDDSNGDWI